MPIELSLMRSPSAFNRLTIEEDSDERGGHGNAATSFGLESPESPILVDLDVEEVKKRSRQEFVDVTESEGLRKRRRRREGGPKDMILFITFT
jgi:hypothetical protein